MHPLLIYHSLEQQNRTKTDYNAQFGQLKQIFSAPLPSLQDYLYIVVSIVQYLVDEM